MPKPTDAGEKLAEAKPPCPVRLEVRGEPFAVTDTDPVRNPRAVGAKLTWITQLLPVPKGEPQLFVWAKSPLVVTEEGETQPCVAVSVAAWPALIVPTGCVPKSSEAGESVAAGLVARTNSYAPRSTVSLQVVALPKAMRGSPSRSTAGRFGAALLPASITGEVA